MKRVTRCAHQSRSTRHALGDDDLGLRAPGPRGRRGYYLADGDEMMTDGDQIGVDDGRTRYGGRLTEIPLPSAERTQEGQNEWLRTYAGRAKGERQRQAHCRGRFLGQASQHASQQLLIGVLMSTTSVTTRGCRGCLKGSGREKEWDENSDPRSRE